jgi:ADP-heptose:LPS heptosyltransferase
VLLAGRLAAAGSGGPLAILALARGGDVRSWPLERWAECAEALVGGGARVLALSGPEEEAEGRAFAARLGERARIAHWIGQRGLRELAACFAAAAELGGVLVACDSGPMHLGWTQGLRVVLLAGPQDPARTGPWPAVAPGARAPAAGSRHAVVRADAPPACAPCRSRRCSHPAGPVCMAHIDGRAAALAALASGQAPRSHA